MIDGLTTIASAQNWFLRVLQADSTYALEPIACWGLLVQDTGLGVEALVAQGNSLVPASTVYETYTYVYPEGWHIDTQHKVWRLTDDMPPA